MFLCWDFGSNCLWGQRPQTLPHVPQSSILYQHCCLCNPVRAGHLLDSLLWECTLAKRRSEYHGNTSISNYDARHVLPSTSLHDLLVCYRNERAYYHHDRLWSSNWRLCATRVHKCLCLRARVHWSLRLYMHSRHYSICGFLLLRLFQSKIQGSELIDESHFDGLGLKFGLLIEAQRGVYVLLLASVASARDTLLLRYHHISGSLGSVDNSTEHRSCSDQPILLCQLYNQLLHRKSHRGRWRRRNKSLLQDRHILFTCPGVRASCYPGRT